MESKWNHRKSDAQLRRQVLTAKDKDARNIRCYVELSRRPSEDEHKVLEKFSLALLTGRKYRAILSANQIMELSLIDCVLHLEASSLLSPH